MVNIYHELGHALILRRLGIPITKFELERGEDFFGGVGFSPGGVPRDRQVVAAFAGPLAEVRYSADNQVIDKERSLTSLARALVGPPGVEVYYQSVEAPRIFGKHIFGTDWNEINRLFADTLAENPELNAGETYRALLGEAIDRINDPANWNIIIDVAAQLFALEQVQHLLPGQTIDITGMVQELIDAKL